MLAAGVRNQTDLAERVGVTSSAVNTWVRDRRKPDISMAEPLARALGLQRLDVLLAMVSAGPGVSKDTLARLADILEVVDGERASLIVELVAAAQSLPAPALEAKLEELRILGKHYRRMQCQPEAGKEE